MKIEIFKTGTHVDSSGKSREWTDEDLDSMVTKYNPAEHEAPVVIGHPKDNAPAYGWVESLSHKGGVLYATLKDLVPEFVDAVKQKMYKKRSISLYPDMTLRHIGFLGAMPPAVKGLADVQFAASTEAVTIEFGDDYDTRMIGGIFRRLREWIIEKFGSDTADRVVADWEINELQKPEEPPVENQPLQSAFKEGDEMEKEKIKELEETLRQKEAMLAEFAEKEAKTKQEARSAAIKAEVAQLVASGKVTPAWVTAGIVEFMAGLDSDVTEYQFSEGGAKQNRLDWFRAFLRDLPKVIEFGEVARRTAGMAIDTNDPHAIVAAAKEYQEKNSGVSFSEAVMLISQNKGN